MFLKIGITLPGSGNPTADEISCEGKLIKCFLAQKKIDIVHIRKPDWSREETEVLINSISSDLHTRIKLHDHFSLLNRFDLGGVHLNSRNPVPPSNARSVSKSLHSIAELMATCGTCYDYVTLSPIYDSISKPGYNSPFPEDLSSLTPFIVGKNVVALGGVTPERLPFLESIGFYGAAMMGALWNEPC